MFNLSCFDSLSPHSSIHRTYSTRCPTHTGESHTHRSKGCCRSLLCVHSPLPLSVCSGVCSRLRACGFASVLSRLLSNAYKGKICDRPQQSQHNRCAHVSSLTLCALFVLVCLVTPGQLCSVPLFSSFARAAESGRISSTNTEACATTVIITSRDALLLLPHHPFLRCLLLCPSSLRLHSLLILTSLRFNDTRVW
jgi:hypothetical protein